MARVTRREALELVGGAALAGMGCGSESGRSPTPVAAGPVPTPAPAPRQSPTAPALRGRILGFGIASAAIRNAFGRSERELPLSVLVDLDLASGEVRHTPHTVAEGHEPLPIRDDLMMCISDGGDRTLFIDPNSHELVRTLQGGAGFEYSGHARVVGQQAFITKRKRGSGRMEGRLEVVDLKTLEVVNDVPTHGHVPHEIAVLDDRDELAISHYGHFGGGHFTREPYYWDIQEPVVTFLDRKSLGLKRRFVYPRKLALTHMRRGSDGLLYVVAAQYVRNNEAGRAALREVATAKVAEALEPGRLEVEAGRIGVPGPVVAIHPERGIEGELMPEPLHHRRQQSVAHNERTGHVFVTFTYADIVMRIATGSHDIDYLPASTLGLSAPCGIAEIPGTSLMAISGRDSGVTVIDASTKAVVRKYPVKLFSNVHLGYAHA